MASRGRRAKQNAKQASKRGARTKPGRAAKSAAKTPGGNARPATRAKATRSAKVMRGDPVAVSLTTLAKQFGYDARLDSINSGDRGYYQRERMPLDELYENYWDAKYRQYWYSAYYAVPDDQRAALVPVGRSAFETYLAATRSAAGLADYMKHLPPGGASSVSTRMAALRWFDGTTRRPLEQNVISELVERDGFR